MGREVRRVLPNWEHPKNEHGHYIPLFDGMGYYAAVRRWIEETEEYLAGPSDLDPKAARNFHEDCLRDRDGRNRDIVDWHNDIPSVTAYTTVVSPEEATWWQYYESTTEGTPISPAFETPEELVDWLCQDDPDPETVRALRHEGRSPSRREEPLTSTQRVRS